MAEATTPPKRDDSVAAPAREEWRLEHPEMGLIEVITGTAEQIWEIDPGFPDATKQ